MKYGGAFVGFLFMVVLVLPAKADGPPYLEIPFKADSAKLYNQLVESSSILQTSFGDQRLSLTEVINIGLNLNARLIQDRLRLDMSESDIQSAAGTFDPTIRSTIRNSRNRTPLERETELLLGTEVSDSSSQSANFSVSKNLRTGTNLSVFSSLSRFKSRGDSSLPDNESSVEFSIVQPLLKGFGGDIPDSTEKINSIDLESEKLDFSHTVARRVLSLTQNYWNYLRAYENAQIVQKSLARIDEVIAFLKTTDRESVEEDISLAGAAKSERQGDVLAFNETLRSSRDVLGLDMGLNGQQYASIPQPLDKLPRVKPMQESRLGEFLDSATNNRTDVKAILKSLESNEISLKKAKNDLLPDLSVFGTVGYNNTNDADGFSETLLTPFSDRNAMDWSAGVTVSFPFYNDVAKAAVTRAKASQISRQIDAYELKRTISFDVADSFSQITSDTEQLEQQLKTLENFYNVYLEQLNLLEKKKATVFDVLQAETNLTSAETNVVGLLSNYARNLVSFRFNTGALVATEENKNALRVNLQSLKGLN